MDKQERLKREILKNNKMARMIRTMAIETINDASKREQIFSFSEDVILDPREIEDFEEAVSFQSSMILDMLVLYNEYSSNFSEIKNTVRGIRHSDEMQTINEEKEEFDEEEFNQEV